MVCLLWVFCRKLTVLYKVKVQLYFTQKSYISIALTRLFHMCISVTMYTVFIITITIQYDAPTRKIQFNATTPSHPRMLQITEAEKMSTCWGDALIWSFYWAFLHPAFLDGNSQLFLEKNPNKRSYLFLDTSTTDSFTGYYRWVFRNILCMSHTLGNELL